MKKSLIALAAAALSVGAQAATISDSFGIPVVLTTTEINSTGFLDMFNSNLGVLTSAVLTLSSGASFSFTGTNNAAQSQLANITSSTDIAWSSSIGLPGLAVQSLSASSGVQNYAVRETKAFGPLGASDTDVYSAPPGGWLALVQQAGGGTFSLTCQSLSGLTVLGGGGNISTTQQTQAGCGAEIVYTYTERPPTQVPEPGALLLAGLALAGVAGSRKFKKA